MKPRSFKYFMFDWDDNILHMPTRIHLERRTRRGWRKVHVSTAEFARIRRDTVNYRPVGGSWPDALADFHDAGRLGERAFLADTRRALRPVIEGRDRGGPSFRAFKRALIEGRLFAIITARAHGSAALRRGVEYFIRAVLAKDERRRMLKNLRGYVVYFGGDAERLSDRRVLTDYLDLNHYQGVSSPEFRRRMGRRGRAGGAESPEEAKQFAILAFVQHVVEQMRNRRGGEAVSMGFSDDDPNNLAAVETFLRRELARRFPAFRFVVYDTSNPRRRGGRKIVVSERAVQRGKE